MILTKDDTNLPDWVKEVITTDCQYCGSPIASNHDTGVLTERWCSNPNCPGHMAYKIDYIAKYFGVKGIGPAKALEWIKVYQPESHLEIIPTWFNNEKPKESLSRIADLCCIKEFGITTGKSVLDQYASFEEFFSSDNSLSYPILLEHSDELLEAEKYFNVRKPMRGMQLNVMATGSIHGYPNRDDFFETLNEAFGDVVHIIQVGARKTNVFCLVKEEDAVDHKKSRIAQECNIPIMTSQQFAELIAEYAAQQHIEKQKEVVVDGNDNT